MYANITYSANSDSTKKTTDSNFDSAIVFEKPRQWETNLRLKAGRVLLATTTFERFRFRNGESLEQNEGCYEKVKQ